MVLLPLESNPDVMNKFIHLLGVPTKWNIVDVYGLDNDALAWVPRPVLAIILLFPCSEKFYDYAKQESESLKEAGQEVSTNLFYMKQYVSNACGSIALIHSIANNVDRINLEEGVFKKLLEAAKGKTPEERGEMLAKPGNDANSEAFKLISAHQELAMEGQTEANPNEQVNHHFVAFVEKDGNLYELDGRKDFPINHGTTSQETFLEDAAKVCRNFMERDSEDINFTIMALTASDS
ncbi:ubiquitin carboxyl-terminal hydrolase [Anoplophora glabripennis]|uniref:ubiquitin carboxyl-terminal hydrolase n=1 Tax=Anoplophora glabripennis TaxID=217634 RepID=UPI0008750FC0|nr:ubiquitin carboxyl-terminal hydrolase [Anoplophora glabripennis]